MKERDMDAQTVIESYVHDVTQHLARRDRADVTLELRALLGEELADRATQAGRPADASMAMELLASFGPPGQVAGRYRPANALIDPADTRQFLIAAVVGAVGLAAAAVAFGQPPSPKDALTVAILSWLGLLVVFFALRSWARRHWPGLVAWKPRDRDRVSRFASLALVGIIVVGIVAYGAPAWVYAEFTGSGRLAPWMARMAYAPDFQAIRLPCLLVLWGAQALLAVWVGVEGRWRRLTRRIEAGLALGVPLVLVWFLAAGPIVQAPAIDHTVKAWLAIITLGVFVDACVKLSRLVGPFPPTPRQGRSTLAA
jgi:hypothetical protein